MLTIGDGPISGMLTVGGNGIQISARTETIAAEGGSRVVNEDGSGDGILFENDDQWVTE